MKKEVKLEMDCRENYSIYFNEREELEKSKKEQNFSKGEQLKIFLQPIVDEYDFINYDKMQRTKFSKQELDSIFMASTNVLPIINMLKNEEMDKDIIEDFLRSLKTQQQLDT